MPLFVKFQGFLRNLFSSRRVEADLAEEVQTRLETLAEENIRAGMPPHAAQRAARIELGAGARSSRCGDREVPGDIKPKTEMAGC